MEDILFERAYQLYKVKRYPEAISYLQEALQRSPEDYSSKSLLVKCYLELGDYERAEKLNESLIAIYPNDSDLFYNRAIIARHQADNTSAKDAIETAIQIDSHVPEYFGYKSFLLLESKDYEDSLFYANEGLQLDSNNILCLNVRAQVLTKLNRIDEAQETVSNTLNQDPEGSFSQANVGWVQLEQGNYQKAQEHFKEALKSDPTSRFAKDGMLEAIKAKNVVYRMYLKYAFWISNMKTKNQLFFVIGIYLLYRFLVKTVQFSEYPYLVYFIIVPYLLFALGGWIIQPLSSSILLFNPYGKYLLDAQDRFSGLVFFVFTLFSILNLGVYFIVNLDVLLLVSISFLCAIVPVTKGILHHNLLSKWIGYGVGGGILLIGIVGNLFTDNLAFLGTSCIIGLVAFTWIDNFVKD